MKRNSLFNLLTMLISLISVNAYAHDIEVQNGGKIIYYKFINNNTELAVTYRGTTSFEYNKEYSGDIVIPKSVTYQNTTYSVTSIWNSAFSDCSGLTSISIPNSVTSIGESAFDSCSGLTSISIPNSVTSIGEGAFNSCSGLTSITIPNSVTSIGRILFTGCTNLASLKVEYGNTKYDSRGNCNAIIITETNELICGIKNTIIPNSVTSIGEAFMVCTGLTSITIPNSVTSIDGSAFWGCSSLNSVSVEIDTPLSITENVFSNRTNAKLYVPAGCKAAYEAADYWKEFKEIIETEALTGNIEFAIPKVKAACVAKWDTNHDGELSYEEAAAVTSLADADDINDKFVELSSDSEFTSFDEFQYFTGVTSITINDFAVCEHLTSITLPNSITDIGDNAFHECPLTSIHIPASVNSIGTLAFYPKFLQAITVDPDNTKFISPTGSNTIINIGSKTLILGCGNTDFTKIPNTGIVETVGQSAFEFTTFANPTISLPTTVKSIVKDAFWGSNITSINLGDLTELTNIGNQAFYLCNGLREVTIPASITEMGISVFGDCENIVKVVSNIEEPFEIPNDLGSFVFCTENAVLYVPTGKAEAYRTAGWEEIYYNLKSFRTITDDDSTAPEAIEGLVYNGKDQKLIHPGTYRAGMMEYSLDGETYSTSVPTGKNAGDYTVYYRKVGESVASTLTATIADKEDNQGSTFTAKTVEGIDMVFTILDESEKTCQVGYFDGSSDKLAINKESVEGHVTIPETANGYTVVKIGKFAFDNTIKMTSVTIPESVTSIDENAFYNCNGLTSFELPANVVSLGNRALSSLRSVEFLKVAEGNSVYDSRGNCNAIIETTTNKLLFGSKITKIPADVTEIGKSAFENLDNYTLTIPSTVTKIDDNAFYFCANWALQVEHTSPLEISENVFSSMGNTTTLRVPAGSKAAYAAATGWNSFGTIEEGYEGCSFTAKTVEGIDMVFTILDESEKTCQVGYLDGSWENVAVDRDAVNGAVTIPSTYNGYTVVKIGKHAFNNIWGMTSVTIPETVTYLDDYAFHNCFSLTSLELSASVTDIGNNALSYLSNVTSIKVAEGNTKYDSRGDCNAIIETATNKLLFGCKKTIIPASVTEIGSYAFQSVLYDCIISIPSTITKIDDYAFGGLTMALQVEHTTPLEINETVFDNNVTSSTLYVPAGCKAAYEAADYWKEFMAIEEIGIVLPADKLFSGSNLWAGYVAAEDLAIPTGLEAYVITNLGTTTATASPLDYIPQGEPVLLKRDDTTISSYEFVSGTGTAPTMNLLKAYDTDKSLSNREGFILYNDEFVLVNEGTLPAGRVFLPANNALLSRGLTRSIEIDDDNATGIEDNKMFVDDADGQWFDLQGRRLEKKPTKKGLYILKGRKVIVK